MNRKSAVLTLSIGIASAIVAVALALDLGGLSSVLPLAATGGWDCAGCAAAFEQISTAGVLTIIAVEVVASIVYFAQIARMQRIM